MNNDTEQSAHECNCSGKSEQSRRGLCAAADHEERSFCRARTLPTRGTREISFRAVRSARDSCPRIYYSEYDSVVGAQEIPLPRASSRIDLVPSRMRPEFPRLQLQLVVAVARRRPSYRAHSRYVGRKFQCRVTGDRRDRRRVRAKNGAYFVFAHTEIYTALRRASARKCGKLEREASECPPQYRPRILC